MPDKVAPNCCNARVCCTSGDPRYPKCAHLIYQRICLARAVLLHLAVSESRQQHRLCFTFYDHVIPSCPLVICDARPNHDTATPIPSMLLDCCSSCCSVDESLFPLYTNDRCIMPVLHTVILLPAHPASFAHNFLLQRVLASPGMQ